MSVSLGMIENIGMIASIEAADSALKAAEVKLVDIEFVRGGITTVMIEGEVSAVKAGIDAAVAAVSRFAKPPAVSVIPRLSADAERMLPNAAEKQTEDRQPKPQKPAPSEKPAIGATEETASAKPLELEKMTKRALLAFAEKAGISPALLRGLRKNEIIAWIKNHKHMGDE